MNLMNRHDLFNSLLILIDPSLFLLNHTYFVFQIGRVVIIKNTPIYMKPFHRPFGVVNIEMFSRVKKKFSSFLISSKFISSFFDQS